MFAGDAWGYDKGAFKSWVTAASKGESPQKGQLHGYLALSFGEVDVDIDGVINGKDLDSLLEKVASLPHWYGLAPNWQQEYEGDVSKRSASRKFSKGNIR